jgi:type II secretory pathway pseudopilin PulG
MKRRCAPIYPETSNVTGAIPADMGFCKIRISGSGVLCVVQRPLNHRDKPGGEGNFTCLRTKFTSLCAPCTIRPSQQVHRRGFSLIEVLIATAILMGSAVVLTRLAGMGRDQLNKARLHAQAQQMCENTLNEILLGLRPMQNVSVSPLLPVSSIDFSSTGSSLLTTDFSNEPNVAETDITLPETDVNMTNPQQESDWQYRVTIVPVPAFSGLTSLSVHVWQADEQSEQRETDSGATSPKRVRFSLTRWIRNPSSRQHNAAESTTSLVNEGFSGGELP